MGHYKISKLLNDSSVSKFVTKKWIKVNDLSGCQYFVNKNIWFKTSMLRSDYVIIAMRKLCERKNSCWRN